MKCYLCIMRRKITLSIVILALTVLLAAFVVRGVLLTKVATTIVNDEAAWDLRDSSPSMEVVVLENGMVARFVRETDSTFVADIQDEFEVPKDGAVHETWYACDGKGVVWLGDYGIQPAFSQPEDADAEVVGHLVHEEGDVPLTYRCLGFKDGWFTVQIDGRTGYIQEDKVVWNAVDSF